MNQEILHGGALVPFVVAFLICVFEETWEKFQIKTFGNTATNFAGFKRLVNTLQSDAGRQKLLRCVQNRLPLSGRPCDRTRNHAA